MKLNLTLGQIREMVGGESSLDHSFFVANICSLDQATEADVAIVFDPEEGSVFPPLAEGKIKSSRAGLIIASKPVVEGKQYLIVSDPLQALNQLVRTVQGRRNAQAQLPVMTVSGAFVSPSAQLGQGVEVGAGAVIEDGAQIGDACIIGAQVYIGKDVVIGRQALIHPGVKILEQVTIGDNVIIHPNAVLGSDGFGYRITRRGLLKIPHIGTVKVGHHVEIGAHTAIDRAAFDQTSLGDMVKIGNAVAISHNVTIGAGSVVLAHTVIAGSVVIGRGCQIGAQVTMRDHITLGDGCKVVSTSGLMKDVKAGAIVGGNPAMPFNDWKRIAAATTRLPEMARLAADLKPALERLNRKSWIRNLFGL